MKVISGAEIARLCQQPVELRDALRPFAAFAEALPPVIEGQPRLTDSGPAFTTAPLGKNYVITFADPRNAKALLERLSEEDMQRHIFEAETKMTAVPCLCCGLLTNNGVYCDAECRDCYELAVDLFSSNKESP
jgi:hypothetical protein